MTVLKPVLGKILGSVLSSVLGDSAITRFITDLVNPAGSMNFSIPQVLSGESITMDVFPRSGNSGLPSGAPAVTNNVFQTITFTLTGNMDFIGREGANFFDGFIKNVLVDSRIYKINEDFGTTTTLIDSGGGGQNGTALNISESGLFAQKDNGDLLSVVNTWNLGNYTYTGSEGALATLLSNNDLTSGVTYEWEWTQNVVGTAETRLRLGAEVSRSSVSGTFTGVDVASGANQRLQSGADSSLAAGTTVTVISVKQILEVAP